MKTNWNIYVLLIASVIHSGFSIRPAIVEGIVDEVKHIDTVATLNCTVALYNNPPDNVQWSVVGGRKLSQGSKIVGKNSLLPGGFRKYEVRVHTGRTNFIPDMGYAELQTFTMFIRSIQYTDAGLYKCKIDIPGDTNASPEVTAQLIVPREPVINSQSVTPNQVVEEGSSVNLTCSASAQPEPRISWNRANGKPLNVPGMPQRVYGKTFKLNNVTREDRGVYRCHANNNVGYGATHDVRIDVNYAPGVRAARLYGMYLQAPDRNFEITLECISSGYPDPEVSFYTGNVVPRPDQLLPDSQLIKNSPDFAIERLRSQGAVGTDVNEFFYTLRIKNVISAHFGNYTCVAKNKYGVAAATLQLLREEICQGPLCFGSGGTAGAGSLFAAPALLLIAAAAAANAANAANH